MGTFHASLKYFHNYYGSVTTRCFPLFLYFQENGPEFFELELTGLQIGGVAFVGFPGEPFTDIGRQVKTAEGWKLILPCCIVNGYSGYFPTADAFREGGYEANTSSYHSTVAETLVKGAKALLAELRG